MWLTRRKISPVNSQLSTNFNPSYWISCHVWIKTLWLQTFPFPFSCSRGSSLSKGTLLRLSSLKTQIQRLSLYAPCLFLEIILSSTSQSSVVHWPYKVRVTLYDHSRQMASQRIKTRKVQTKDQYLTLMSIFQIFWGNKSKCNYATVLYMSGFSKRN